MPAWRRPPWLPAPLRVGPGFSPRCRCRDLRPAQSHPSNRQRLLVEHCLGESSGSAVDGARRAGYPWPEKPGGNLSRNVQKRGVQATIKVTKRRALYGRNHLGCRDLQAAIPEVLDALPTKCSHQAASLMTLNFQQFDDVSLMPA
jgi:hypothetical protein